MSILFRLPLISATTPSGFVTCIKTIVLPTEGDFPAENVAITKVDVIASIDLSESYSELQGKTLRARIIEVAPEGVVAFHVHQARPGIAYLIEGTMIENKSAGEAVVHNKDSFAIERHGVGHWWNNPSDTPARIFVVDIIDSE